MLTPTAILLYNTPVFFFGQTAFPTFLVLRILLALLTWARVCFALTEWDPGLAFTHANDDSMGIQSASALLAIAKCFHQQVGQGVNGKGYQLLVRKLASALGWTEN